MFLWREILDRFHEAKDVVSYEVEAPAEGCADEPPNPPKPEYPEEPEGFAPADPQVEAPLPKPEGCALSEPDVEEPP